MPGALLCRFIVVSLVVIHIRGWRVRNIVSVLRVRDAKLTPSAYSFETIVRTRFGEMAHLRVRGQN